LAFGAAVVPVAYVTVLGALNASSAGVMPDPTSSAVFHTFVGRLQPVGLNIVHLSAPTIKEIAICLAVEAAVTVSTDSLDANLSCHTFRLTFSIDDLLVLAVARSAVCSRVYALFTFGCIAGFASALVVILPYVTGANSLTFLPFKRAVIRTPHHTRPIV
jgi:hypothetical protein